MVSVCVLELSILKLKATKKMYIVCIDERGSQIRKDLIDPQPITFYQPCSYEVRGQRHDCPICVDGYNWGDYHFCPKFNPDCVVCNISRGTYHPRAKGAR